MASFNVYDPRRKVFRALETSDTIDFPLEQVLLINILIELRAITSYLAAQDEMNEDPDDVRAAVVQEVN